jgi:hypothetical protein
MRVVFRSGVRVREPEAPIAREFPAKEFKVLDNGALELSGPERVTFAPGAWLSVAFILSESDADAGGSA